MKNHLSVLLTLLVSTTIIIFHGCGASKQPIPETDWQQIENTVAERKFTFFPKTLIARQTDGDVVGRSAGNLKMDGDQVDMELVEFVSNQSKSSYAFRRAGSLRVLGTVTDIRTNRNKSGKYFDLEFNVRSKLESLQCEFRFFSANYVVLTINSRARSFIQYEGIITENTQLNELLSI